MIPDIRRSSHNPDITLSEIGFVLFGAKNTFAGKKGWREEAEIERRADDADMGGSGTGQTDFVRSFVRSSDCLGKRNAWLQSIE